MLRLYISYAPADKPYLDKLLKWLKPLEERYFLQISYPDPKHIPRFLYLQQYHPASGMIVPADWEKMLNRLEEAHLYLFLTSYNSLSTPYIEQEVVPRAVERYQQYGKNYVRIFPVVLSPSQWKQFSGLSGFPPLGGPSTLVESKPEEEGYRLIAEQLQVVVEELRRNWIEETHRLGLPVDSFFQAPRPAAKSATFQSLPGWAGAVMLLALLYMVASFYFRSCAPRMYYLYTPPAVLPYEPPPERYLRNYPVEPPYDVPLRPDEDTLHLSDE